MINLAAHNHRPELFRVVPVEIPPHPAPIPAVLPKPEHFDAILCYLSWKALRGAPYSEPYTDGVDRQQVIRRDLARPFLGSTILVREVHGADKPRQESLKRIYVGDRGLGAMTDEVAGRIAPRTFSVYDAVAQTVHHVPLMDFPEGKSDEDAFEMADMEIAAGLTETGMLIAEHQLYSSLAVLARMKPPLPRQIK